LAWIARRTVTSDERIATANCGSGCASWPSNAGDSAIDAYMYCFVEKAEQ